MDEWTRETELNSAQEQAKEEIKENVNEILNEAASEAEETVTEAAAEVEEAAAETVTEAAAEAEETAAEAASEAASEVKEAAARPAPEPVRPQRERTQMEYGYGYRGEEPSEKKKGGIGKKILGVIAAGVVIGLIAFGVNRGMAALFPAQGDKEGRTPSQSQEYADPQETQKETTAQIPETEKYADPQETVGPQKEASASVMDVSDVVEAALPSVVAINNELEVTSINMWGQTTTQKTSGSGSGVIIDQTDKELLIVTNAHVVNASSSESYFYDISSVGLTVSFCDGQEVAANLKGSDTDADLAVIAVPLESLSEETLKNITIARIGDSDLLKVGNGVIAIGNALGFGQSVTVGYVSALNRDVTIDGVTRSLLQTDAAINPGNSGGALLNVKGELIGINSAKYSEESVEGIGYAIPISQALSIIDELKTAVTREVVPEAERGYLGIRGQTVDSASSRAYGIPQGIYIDSVLEGTPAEKSDLQSRDILTKVDGKTVTTMSDLQSLLRYYRAGETVNLTVQRPDGRTYKEVTLVLTLAGRDQMPQE